MSPIVVETNEWYPCHAAIRTLKGTVRIPWLKVSYSAEMLALHSCQAVTSRQEAWP